jgi:hypothetical protein
MAGRTRQQVPPALNFSYWLAPRFAAENSFVNIRPARDDNAGLLVLDSAEAAL